MEKHVKRLFCRLKPIAVTYNCKLRRHSFDKSAYLANVTFVSSAANEAAEPRCAARAVNGEEILAMGICVLSNWIVADLSILVKDNQCK